MASETPAMTKASASCFLENLRGFEDGVCALVACLLAFVGGGVMSQASRLRGDGGHDAFGNVRYMSVWRHKRTPHSLFN